MLSTQFYPFVTGISKSTEWNRCLKLKLNSDFRDSDVRDAFINVI